MSHQILQVPDRDLPVGTKMGRPLIFGELLYDSFPDGSRVLGGAPFNVAWHLAGLGLDPLLVTRVGDDPAGHQALESMEKWGLDCSAVQLDSQHPTGEVQVSFVEGEPEFTIAPEQAWDFIDAEMALKQLGDITPTLLYHGTLAARHEAAATALRTLRAEIALRFVDLNLRAPWWSDEIVDEAVSEASWLKLNREELNRVSAGAAIDQGVETAAHLRERHGLAGVILTLGADGAVIAAEELLRAETKPAEVGQEADPVGAGDAFAAACIAGILKGRPLVEILENSMALAAKLCTVRGAVLHDRSSYRKLYSPGK